MLFNRNIILEVLRSNFAKNIKEFVDKCIMEWDGFDLDDIFEEAVDFALLDSVEEMTIEEYNVEDENGGQTVDGICEITVAVNGFIKAGEDVAYRDTQIAVLGIGFSFYVENDKFSDMELEYLY